jgi:hypothetical protein
VHVHIHSERIASIDLFFELYVEASWQNRPKALSCSRGAGGHLMCQRLASSVLISSAILQSAMQQASYTSEQDERAVVICPGSVCACKHGFEHSQHRDGALYTSCACAAAELGLQSEGDQGSAMDVREP